MSKQFNKWILALGVCSWAMTVQAFELPDCDAISMMLAPLVVVPGTLQPPSKLPLVEVITRIGRPSKWNEVGSIYRWHKSGYTLTLTVTKINHSEQTTTSLDLPVKRNLTAEQIQADTPLEFTEVMQTSSNHQLITAKKILGATPKLKMFSYVWPCFAYASVTNGYSVTRESKVVINFDEKGNWINGTF